MLSPKQIKSVLIEQLKSSVEGPVDRPGSVFCEVDYVSKNPAPRVWMMRKTILSYKFLCKVSCSLFPSASLCAKLKPKPAKNKMNKRKQRIGKVNGKLRVSGRQNRTTCALTSSGEFCCWFFLWPLMLSCSNPYEKMALCKCWEISSNSKHARYVQFLDEASEKKTWQKSAFCSELIFLLPWGTDVLLRQLFWGNCALMTEKSFLAYKRFAWQQTKIAGDWIKLLMRSKSFTKLLHCWLGLSPTSLFRRIYCPFVLWGNADLLGQAFPEGNVRDLNESCTKFGQELNLSVTSRIQSWEDTQTAANFDRK